jgi:hypothetical protein
MYQHTGNPWLWYAIYLSAVMTFTTVFKAIGTWPQYIGDAICFHGRCIRDKQFEHSVKADVRHTGGIDNRRK